MRTRQAWTPGPEPAGDALTALDPESEEREAIVSYSDPVEDIVTATLQDGGGTWTRDLVPVHEHYVWAVGGAIERYSGMYSPKVSQHAPDLSDRVRSAIGTLLLAGAEYVGTWMDDGLVYIDAVSLIPDRDRAIAAGQRRGELAIYNLGTHETVEIELS